MAGVYKRGSDKKRGESGKYTGWHYGADGKKVYFAGTTDKRQTLAMAQAKENEQRLIKEGLIDARDVSARRASVESLAKHIEDYRLNLLAKGDEPKHANHVASTLTNLMAESGITKTTEILPDLIQGATGRMVFGRKKSARTANHALGSARAFTKWLVNGKRLKDDPLTSLVDRYNEKVDVRYRRRDVSIAQLAILIEATKNGSPLIARKFKKSRHLQVLISGPERVILYRIAMGTGFRASEIASLLPENFDLGPDPTIMVKAAYSKRRRDDTQLIRRDLADILRPWLAGKNPGEPVLIFPVKTAKMLRVDLEAAGIPYKTKDGVVDFHALRASYITHLIEKGATIKTVQELARHSTATLTIERYAKTDEKRKRDALEDDDPGATKT